MHVFTYSERKNTGALKITGNVPHGTRKDRTNQLISLSEKKRRAYYDRFIGTTQHVLFEAENQESYMYGFTENYLKVRMPYDPLYINEVREVKILSQNAEGIMEIRLTNSEDIAPALKARMAV